GLVHDVVVVEAREVGQLDPGRGRDDLVGDPLSELGDEHRQHRPEALATRPGQVQVDLGDELVLVAGTLVDQPLDPLQPCGEAGVQRVAGLREAEDRRRRAHVAHRGMKTLDCSSTSSSGPGRTPRSTVTTTPIAMTASESAAGDAMVTSPAGSVKNIRTMTRM